MTGLLASAQYRSARPAARDRYNEAVRSAVRERHRDAARERAAYRAGRGDGLRTGVVAGAVHSEIRREARRRYYRGIVIYRPHGIWYPGFGYYRDDSSAWKWLAFTAITLKVLDNLNEAAQRKHEDAQIRAATAAIGQPQVWSDGSYRGSVTATRESYVEGRQCREFRQTVEIGGKSEDAYGTACLQPDGSWQIRQ
jgi:hypothetical protein